MPATETLSYGDHPSQIAHVRLPEAGSGDTGANGGPRPVVVLLHGGWWRDIHAADLMDPLAADLAGAGYLVWNVEYRRTGADGGGWPQTLDDVCLALELLRRRLADGADPGDPRRVVAVGHSAGGHLALLAAPESPLTAVVGLAPVTDLRASAKQGLGEGATDDFLGPDPTDDVLAAASPLHRVPTSATQLVVHGDADQRVPVEQSRAYAAAAGAAGAQVAYREVPGADHFAVIDPAHQAWREVRGWLATL